MRTPRYRRWCYRCDVGSLEADCFVCGDPMEQFISHRVNPYRDDTQRSA